MDYIIIQRVLEIDVLFAVDFSSREEIVANPSRKMREQVSTGLVNPQLAVFFAPQVMFEFYA